MISHLKDWQNGEFIGENIRLDPVVVNEEADLDQILAYYMGKNSPDRQEFIIENLRVEVDEVEEESMVESSEAVPVGTV